MSIQGVFNSISHSVKSCCSHALQTAQTVGPRLKDLRNDPDFFQKVCQVAFNAIQLVTIHVPDTGYLSRFYFTLKTANMHDFYTFVKTPRQWFYPVTAEAIDEDAVLESLVELLKEQYLVDKNEEANQAEEANEAEEANDEEVDEAEIAKLRDIAKRCLEDQLEQMSNKNDAYRNVDEFKEVLQRHLAGAEWNKDYDFNEVDLKDLNVPLRHVPFIEHLNRWNWSLVDMGCVALYLQEWNLLDTAKWAESIGQNAGLSWVKNQRLETWVVGLVTSAFMLKLLEAVRKLHDTALTSEERRINKWNCLTSTAEIVAFGSIFLNLIGKTNISNSCICILAIVAKSLGLAAIIDRTRRERPDQFFQQREVAA